MTAGGKAPRGTGPSGRAPASPERLRSALSPPSMSAAARRRFPAGPGGAVPLLGRVRIPLP
jgi:hypothetical protein